MISIRERLVALASVVIAHDDALQAVGLFCSGAGVWWSVYLLREAIADRRDAAQDLLTQTVLSAHVRSASVVLVVQCGFAVVNLLVLGLPEMPAHEMHPWVLVTVASRKVIRNALIVFLMGAVWRQTENRRLVLRLLAERQA